MIVKNPASRTKGVLDAEPGVLVNNCFLAINSIANIRGYPTTIVRYVIPHKKIMVR